MYATIKVCVLALLLTTSVLIIIEYLHLSPSSYNTSQLSDGFTKVSAIHYNIDRTGRNLKWAEGAGEEDYFSHGTDTLLPVPSVGRPDMESPTTVPHLSWDETLRIISASQNQDILARSKWQVSQVNKFCSKYNMSNVLPVETAYVRRNLFRHLIFNDEKKFIFCFLPKAGCTNLRRLVFIINGLLPKETAKLETIPEDYLVPAMKKASFLNTTLTVKERMERIKTYYKFIMIRNPLERLVSAYRDKLEHILTFNSSYEKNPPLLKEHTFPKGIEFFELHKRWILTKYKPLDVLKWAEARGTNELQLAFSDYVQWIVDSDDDTLNEHFASIFSVSRPCMVHYHFYANFKNYSREVHLLMKALNTSQQYFTDHNTHYPWEETRVLLHKYYSQLSDELKYRLFQRMFMELDFYYHLYPEEQWSHAELLGITEPVLT